MLVLKSRTTSRVRCLKKKNKRMNRKNEEKNGHMKVCGFMQPIPSCSMLEMHVGPHVQHIDVVSSFSLLKLSIKRSLISTISISR